MVLEAESAVKTSRMPEKFPLRLVYGNFMTFTMHTSPGDVFFFFEILLASRKGQHARL